MYSTIYVIEESRYVDLKEESLAKQYEGDKNLPEFADIIKEGNLDTDFNELVELFQKIGCDPFVDIDKEKHTFIFKKGFKENYFNIAWQRLEKHIDQVDAFHKFSESVDFAKTATQLINEQHGYYQSDQYGSYQTFDDFVRSISYDVEYSVVETMSYHLY